MKAVVILPALTVALVLGAATLAAEENAAEHARAVAFANKLGAKVETQNTDNGPSIRSLDFGSMNVGDNDLVLLQGLRSLRDLYLDGTQVTSAGLAHLRHLKNLHMLDLADSKISDEGLVHLRGLTGLNTLYLDRTPISDAGLVHLRELKNLKSLDLTSSKCTKQGIDELRKALPGLNISN